MPKKMDEDRYDMKWMRIKKLKIGAGLFILGLILYAKETGIIPYDGSIWTLAMMLAGIVIFIKGTLMRAR
ncbi:MAG: hypothetical protein QW112_03300 [Candidatus Micrarchaeia archaeon]